MEEYLLLQKKVSKKKWNLNSVMNLGVQLQNEFYSHRLGNIFVSK